MCTYNLNGKSHWKKWSKDHWIIWNLYQVLIGPDLDSSLLCKVGLQTVFLKWYEKNEIKFPHSKFVIYNKSSQLFDIEDLLEELMFSYFSSYKFFWKKMKKWRRNSSYMKKVQNHINLNIKKSESSNYGIIFKYSGLQLRVTFNIYSSTIVTRGPYWCFIL